MTLERVSQLLIFLAACDWILTAVLYRASRQLPEPALVERATASVILSTIASIGAFLGAYVLGWFDLPPGTTTVLLSVGFVLVSAPQFIWAVGLAAGKFR